MLRFEDNLKQIWLENSTIGTLIKLVGFFSGKIITIAIPDKINMDWIGIILIWLIPFPFSNNFMWLIAYNDLWIKWLINCINIWKYSSYFFIVRMHVFIPWRLKPHHGKRDWKCAEEEHEEKESKVEIVGTRCSEHSFVRNVAGHHSPRTDVHEHHQFDQIQRGQTGREEHTHPHHALVLKYKLVDRYLGDISTPDLQRSSIKFNSVDKVLYVVFVILMLWIVIVICLVLINLSFTYVHQMQNVFCYLKVTWTKTNHNVTNDGYCGQTQG